MNLYCRAYNQHERIYEPADSVSLMNIPDDAIVLYDRWQMRESYYVGLNGMDISSVGYKSSDWYSATVPSTVLGVLVQHGVYPDPYIGLNNMKIPDASDDVNKKYDLAKYSHLPEERNPWSKPYWFRTEFVVPESYKGKTVALNFNGLNYRADIWVNGKQIADSAEVVGMFRRFRFDVSDIVKVGEKNALAVCIYPLDYPGNQFRAPLDGPYGPLGGPGGDGEILRNVTQYCTIGWDWIPSVRDRNMGLWQHVYLNASGDVRVYDPVAFTEFEISDTSKANVTVRCMLENFSDCEKKVKLNICITPAGFAGDTIKLSQLCTMPADTVVEFTSSYKDHPSLIMKNPKLWWPRNYGAQNLYNLEIEVEDGGDVASKAENRFGVRSVGTCILPSGGRAFTVNGRIIRFNGGAWVPDFMLTWNRQRYIDEVRLMAEGNHSVVRVNGCGIVVPDAFLDACDEYGLLVWQELSRTSVEASSKKEETKNWTPPYVDPSIYLENMTDCILRLRSHPSLVIWCGSNEAAPQSDIGKALQNRILPQLDGTRVWLPASEETPAWSNIETRGWTGGPWDIKRLKDYYRMYSEGGAFAFKNEIGLASPPNINTIAAVVPDYDKYVPEWFPFNKSVSYHDAAGFTFKALNDLILADLGKPASLNEYMWMGNIYNNMAYRTIFEAANKARPLNAGTMLWKSNAAWPSFNWQVYDWFLRTNAGYYSMRSACKPLHVQASIDDLTIQVSSMLSSDMLDMVLHVDVYSPLGKLEASEKKIVSVKSDCIALAGSLPDVVSNGNLHFVSLELRSKDGKILDRNNVWLQKDEKWYDLLKMKLAEIRLMNVEKKDCGDEIRYDFTVKNISKIPAVNAVLALTDGETGNELLPLFWSDNEMTLMPGEVRKLSVHVCKKLLGDNNLMLNVEGFNLKTAEIDILSRNVINIDDDVVDVALSLDNDKVKVSVKLLDAVPYSCRIRNCILPVYIDGRLYRNLLVGVSSGKHSDCILSLDDMPDGKREIRIGNAELKLPQQ